MPPIQADSDYNITNLNKTSGLLYDAYLLFSVGHENKSFQINIDHPLRPNWFCKTIHRYYTGILCDFSRRFLPYSFSNYTRPRESPHCPDSAIGACFGLACEPDADAKLRAFEMVLAEPKAQEDG